MFSLLRLMVAPVLSRLTAAGSGYLLAVGVDASQTEQIMGGLAAAVIVAIDLAQSYNARKQEGA